MPTRGELPASARAAVGKAVRRLIIEGELRPGDRLVERQLADRLGFSRVPVREALRELEHEGFAEQRSTGGLVVRRLDDDVEALFEVRGALEAIICRRVVREADDDGVERLQSVVDEAAAALARSDHRAAVVANARFHEVLLELAGSAVLEAAMAPLAGRMEWLLSQHEDPAAMNADHAAMVQALRGRDATALRRLCREHLAASRAAVASSRRGDAAR